MKSCFSPIALSFVLALSGCGQTISRRNVTAGRTLDDYFQRYCGYTGNMGIGFDASHTYDYEFRQRLARTKDTELKRLFVLYHLYADVDSALSELEDGRIRIGKVEWREMTQQEKEAARTKIVECVDDLTRFHPGYRVDDGIHETSDDTLTQLGAYEITEFRTRLQKLGASPATQ